MPKSLWGWLALAVVIVWVATNPAHAGASVHHWITSAATFASSLTNG